MEELKKAVEEEEGNSDSVPSCVTEHPGFRPVCLEKWSLRYAAGKFSTRQHKRYTQRESENR